ncbi:MAG: hypothetical protein M3373_08135 [Gemmatimonadota bacterium]|nr:hypothetical protein [Gemmatimonadota bacterium]
MSKILIYAIGTAVMLAAACSSPTASDDDFELPAPDLSLDPDRLSVGDYIATPVPLEFAGTVLIICEVEMNGPSLTFISVARHPTVRGMGRL